MNTNEIRLECLRLSVQSYGTYPPLDGAEIRNRARLFADLVFDIRTVDETGEPLEA